jgi:mannose-1-phosphate guanylyltransferase
MKAVVLAAGIGSRLGALTKDTPKCLLPIQGRPLLDYWFESLKLAGVTDVFINVHHLKEQVEKYIASQRHITQVTPFFEPELLGSAGTLKQAREFVGDDKDFFIIYADNFAKLDLLRLLAFHRARNQSILTLVAYPTANPHQCGILELDDDGRVLSFEEKPKNPKTNFANSGIHVASSRIFDKLPVHTPSDIGFHLLPRLIGEMYGYVTSESIIDIGTPESYRAAQTMNLNFN